MDIQKLFNSLTARQKRELKNCFLEEEIKKQELEDKQKREKELNALKARKSGTIELLDFVENVPMSPGLKNHILAEWEIRNRIYYVDDITYWKLKGRIGFGNRRWDELMNIINNSLTGTKYEQYAEALKMHFAKENKNRV